MTPADRRDKEYTLMEASLKKLQNQEPPTTSKVQHQVLDNALAKHPQKITKTFINSILRDNSTISPPKIYPSHQQ
jgi:hypothetical protein